MLDLWACPGPFSTAELAEACRCSQRFVQKAIDAGALEARRLGRLWRIPAEAARRFAMAVGAGPQVEVSGDIRDVRDVRSMRDVHIDRAR